MKVLPFKIPKSEKSALIYQLDEEYQFYPNLHQHEEIQLSIIICGSGDLLVGDTISSYTSGDIMIIGANLPHLFRSEPSEKKSVMLSLFFTRDSFGKTFFDLEELKELETLMKKIEAGVFILSYKEKIKQLFLTLRTAKNYRRLITFLEILELCSKAKTKSLSTFSEQRVYTEDEGSRMNKVMNLAISQYHRKISLEEVAELANMTTNAFCRYFKQRTRKTFFEFLLIVRVEQAAKMLLSSPDRSIAEIAELVGFANLSNFNRKFKAIKGTTPGGHRKKHGR